MPAKEWVPRPGAIAWLEEPANSIMGQSYAEDRRARTNKSLSQEEYLMSHLGMPEVRPPCRRQPLHRSFGRASSAPSLRTCEPAMHSMTLMAEAFGKTAPGTPGSCSPLSWASPPESPSQGANRTTPPASAPALFSRHSTMDFTDIIGLFGETDRSLDGSWRKAASTVSLASTTARTQSRVAMRPKKKHPHAIRVTDAPATLFSQNLCFQAYAATDGRNDGRHGCVSP